MSFSMKLIKCYVSSFGKIKDKEFNFDGGLNTVKEDNGWGKTTLTFFIKAMFYGFSGQKKSINENDRLKYAPWQGGFGTSLSWKGLSLSAQFSWVGDRWMLNNDRYFDESNGRFMTYNQSRRLLNRWKQPGDITDIPRHGEYTEFDSRLLEDASFLRLKNLNLTYNLPANLLKKTGFIRGIRVYVQGQNLLTFTNFSGLDPEGVSNLYAAQYPMSRQYTFGLDLMF